MAQWVVVHGQVKMAKKSKNTPTCSGPPSEPQTENENLFFFSISSRRLAESEDGLDSSLAQSGGELQHCKLAPKFGGRGTWRVKKKLTFQEDLSKAIRSNPKPNVLLELLRLEIPSGICAKFRTVVASNNRVHMPWSLLLLVRATYMYGVVLHAHPVRGESHNQCNIIGEVATTSPPFYNEPHRSHVLCVKAELRTTFTSWSQHHFVAIGNPERHMRKASHCGSKQQ